MDMRYDVQMIFHPTNYVNNTFFISQNSGHITKKLLLTLFIQRFFMVLGGKNQLIKNLCVCAYDNNLSWPYFGS